MKAIHFKKYFASKCTPVENDSSLQSTLEFYSQSKISSLKVLEDILEIVGALDFNKAYGHDQTSLKIIEICDEALVKLLSSILKDYIILPNIWKNIKYCPSLHRKK